MQESHDHLTKQKHVKLEKIQRIAIKMVLELEDITQEERLKEMQLKTLALKREETWLQYKIRNDLE